MRRCGMCGEVDKNAELGTVCTCGTDGSVSVSVGVLAKSAESETSEYGDARDEQHAGEYSSDEV